MVSSLDFNKVFGRNLRRVMAEQDVTQAQMSRDLQIPKTTISGWMNGKRAPKMSTLDRVCEYLRCNRSDLMELHNEQHYHLKNETELIAQSIYDDPDLHALFDAARGNKSENLQLAAEMLKRMKETNPDG